MYKSVQVAIVMSVSPGLYCDVSVYVLHLDLTSLLYSVLSYLKSCCDQKGHTPCVCVHTRVCFSVSAVSLSLPPSIPVSVSLYLLSLSLFLPLSLCSNESTVACSGCVETWSQDWRNHQLLQITNHSSDSGGAAAASVVAAAASVGRGYT